jgi:hypothetical protein
MLIEPASGARRPCRISTVVVLPAPFGPTMQKISPGRTSNETSSTAVTVPYTFLMLLAVMIGSMGVLRC